MKAANKKQTLELLAVEYAQAKPALQYDSVFELLVAVILSAQCTDARVNIITKRLFPQYSAPKDFALLELNALESLIKDAGLYRAKAKNLLATAAIVANKYCGTVPDNFEQLVELPGVGQKTANVVLSVGFGVPAIAVDTHVFRVSNRSGLAKASTPAAVEEQLKRVIPMIDWAAAHHWLIWHGRKACTARKPACAVCIISELCDKNL